MTTIRILLAPMKVMSSMYSPPDNMSQYDLVKGNLSRYLILPPMELGKDLVGVDYTGVSAAEEVFDLTNNPSRQTERMERYGNGRSVSPGDVIEVGDEHYACLSMGWAKLSDERVFNTRREY